MAKTEEDLDLDVDKQPTPAKKGGMKKIIIIVVAAVVLLSAIGGGAWAFLHKTADEGDSAESADSSESADEAKPAEKGAKKAKKGKKSAKAKKEVDPALPAVYLALDPPFVVNFEDQGVVRFLQITVEVGTHDPLVLDAAKLHMPIIRNNLVMLFSSQDLKSVTSREAKEKLRADALAEVRKVLEEQTGDPGVENVYFTSFVMQ